MCNKMVKIYTRFCTDMSDVDPILRLTTHFLSTCAYREIEDEKGNIVATGLSGINSHQIVPSSHKVQLSFGRHAHFDMTVVKMTAEEYNNKVRSKMTSNPSIETRGLAWKNYLVDNGLLPRLSEVCTHAYRLRSFPMDTDVLDKAINKLIKPTHERIAA